MTQQQIELESEAAKVKKYVDRVGTAFALAVYEDEILHQHKRLNDAEQRLTKIKEVLEGTDLEYKDHVEFEIAASLRIDQIWDRITKQEAQRDLVLSFGPIVGSNPGTQENLNSLGIKGMLLSLDEIFAYREDY